MKPGDLIVFEDGQYKNRFGQTKINGNIEQVFEDTANICLYGLIGMDPLDEYVLKGVPLKFISLAEGAKSNEH